MNNFCKVPFSQLEITPNGEARVCCKISTLTRSPDGRYMNLLQDSFDDIWYSQYMKDLREKFLRNERPPECYKCWNDEASGIQSLRLQSEMLHVEPDRPQVLALSLKLSNKCNCACRICSFWLSSLWVNELKKQNQYPIEHHRYIQLATETKLDKNGNFDLIKDMTKNLERLFVYGGEPLMDNEVLEILKWCRDSGESKHIRLIINTNGTIMNPEILNLLQSFHDTSLYFSIDDVDRRYHYQRWPARWEKVSKTLKEINDLPGKPGFQKCLYASISVFNILYLGEILQAFSEFENMPVNLDNIIYDPEILCIYNLPEDVKPFIKKYLDSIRWEYSQFEFAYDYCNNIKSFMDQKVSPYTREEYLVKLDDFLKTDDERRGESWKDVFPQLYELLLGL